MLLPGPGASRCGETGKTAVLNGNYADTLSAGTYRDLEGAGLKKKGPPKQSIERLQTERTVPNLSIRTINLLTHTSQQQNANLSISIGN
jgi:hypothetical protein